MDTLEGPLRLAGMGKDSDMNELYVVEVCVPWLVSYAHTLTNQQVLTAWQVKQVNRLRYCP